MMLRRHSFHRPREVSSSSPKVSACGAPHREGFHLREFVRSAGTNLTSRPALLHDDMACVDDVGRQLLSRCAYDGEIAHGSRSGSGKCRFALGTESGNAFLLVSTCGNHAAGKRLDHCGRVFANGCMDHVFGHFGCTG